MSQPQSTPSGCGPGLLSGILLYLDLALLPIMLKLFGAPRFLAWSWWKATSGIWAPWGLVFVLAGCGALMQALSRLRARG